VVVALLVLSAPGNTSTAQEPTPAGRLGGGAPLDATIPVATAPPTVTPTHGSASPAAIASPVATPVAGPPLSPVACAVEPRSLDDVAALLMLAEAPVTPVPPTVAEWLPEAEAAARAVAAELVACGDAGNQLAAYALLTDAALVEYLVGSQPGLREIRALLFDEAPSLVPVHVTGLETRAAEPGVVFLRLNVGDGRVLAVRLTVAEERGAWRVASIAIGEPTA
jgi:hypothetical protein